MQVTINYDPPAEKENSIFWNPPWNFYWLECPGWNEHDSIICAFRNVFESESERVIRIHVTGDQRYTLFLDGTRIGFGPERGSNLDWFYQTHDLSVSKGTHTLVAIVSRMQRTGGLSHIGHISLCPGLALYAPAEKPEFLNTGIAKWDFLRITGYSFQALGLAGVYACVGARTNINVDMLQSGVEAGLDDAGKWERAPAGQIACTDLWDPPDGKWKMLKHSTLPPMYEKEIRAGRVCHAEELDCSEYPCKKPFAKADSSAMLSDAFQKMLDGTTAMICPPGKTLRFLIDVEDYVCAWPIITLGGGNDGATVHIDWAESLMLQLSGTFSGKGNRNETEGKYFVGFGDSFTAGKETRAMEPLWWEAGRYILVTVNTKDKPLEIKTLILRETHYPHVFESEFHSNDPRWDSFFRIAKRALEMCSHETYFDCPYYEQLMYAGDTRLEILSTYVTTRDSRLPEKAIYMFDRSRGLNGLSLSRTPCAEPQTIPPFSLWWIMMVYDYAFWRNNMDFVKARMPGVRTVLEAFRQKIDDNGILHAVNGWNFTDWVQDWDAGMPKSSRHGANATINLQLAMVLRAAAVLEDLCGEKHLAARNRETADSISAAALKTFWSEEKHMYAEDADKDRFSEHAQCMAILGGASAESPVPILDNSAENVDKTTIYFSHYLFDAYRKLKRPDAIYERLGLWFDLVSNGLRTTIEQPEPTRSDCHAWGTHPMFHAFATFAGIRPASLGFRSVEIQPQFGPLNTITSKMVHPDGFIVLNATKGKDGSCHGSASVPDGISATLVLPNGTTKSWKGGEISF